MARRKLPPIRTPAPTPETSPKCLYCRRRLRPSYKNVYPEGTGIGVCLVMKPIARDFEHWGVDGYFCSKTHGYLFGRLVARGCRDGTLNLTALNP